MLYDQTFLVTIMCCPADRSSVLVEMHSWRPTGRNTRLAHVSSTCNLHVHSRYLIEEVFLTAGFELGVKAINAAVFM